MKNSILRQARQSLKFVMASQILVLALGVIKAFLIPIFIGVENFGYWQIYVFYITFAGMFTLGFNDGIYLRYGGHEYHDLPIKKLRSSVRLYSGLLIFISILLMELSSFERNDDKRLVLYFVSFNVIIMGLNAVFILVLQATNQLKKYSFFNAADKLLFLVFLTGLFFFNKSTYIYFIWVEIISKIIAMIWIMVVCKELVLGPGDTLKSSLLELTANICAGSKLMIANVSGMLILSVGRIFIEYGGNIEEYAFYAFGVSMTNLALVGITALSLVIYPTLKRLPPENYLRYYNEANKLLFIINAFGLIAYFPVVLFVKYYAAKYIPVIQYLNILFIIALLQGKMQLLNNSYYKALRLEGSMLKANGESVLIVLALSGLFYTWIPSAWVIALSALLTMVYRVYASEKFLRRFMNDNSSGTIILELATITAFLLITALLKVELSFFLYCAILGLYCIYNRKDIKTVARYAFGRQ